MQSPLLFAAYFFAAAMMTVSLVWGWMRGVLSDEDGTVEIDSQPVRFLLDFTIRSVAVVCLLFAAAYQAGLVDDPARVARDALQSLTGWPSDPHPK